MVNFIFGCDRGDLGVLVGSGKEFMIFIIYF